MSDGNPLLRVVHEAGAAVLLVDLSDSRVVYANRFATAMAGDLPLPLGVDEWGTRAGLVDPAGRDLADTAGPLSRIARGEAVAGELIRRESTRADDGAGVEQTRQRHAGEVDVADVGGLLWVTGFGLGSGDLSGRALLVIMQLTADTSPEVVRAMAEGGELDDDPQAALSLSDRAVLATDLSFTISDPRQPDHPLIWVNPAFTRTTGYSAEEAVGRNCRFLQGPDTDPAAVDELRAAIADHRQVTTTLLNYRPDGTAFWNQVSLSPVFGPDGELVNYVGIQLDVTLRMQAELEKERAYAAEQRANTRLTLLAAVSDVVADLDGPQALRGLAELLADGFLPWAVLVHASGGSLHVVAAAGLGQDDERQLVGAQTRVRGPGVGRLGAGGDEDPVAQLLLGQTGPHAMIPCDAMPWEAADAHSPDSVSEWLAGLLKDRVDGSCLMLPLPGRHDVQGLLVVGADELGEEDQLVLRDVSRRAGVALDTARLYAREHALAEALQRSMLPEQVSVPGLDVWTYYAPNEDQAQVGGDWYDVMQPAEDVAGLVIGDVVGHDVEAAATMGQLRSVVRSYAYELPDPGTVLMRVDQLARGMRIPRMASLVYATMERGGGDHEDGWLLSWSSAGHLPPLVRSGDGVATLDTAAGMLIGLVERSRPSDERELLPGDVLVLYTDGLIERRRRSMSDGLDQLREALRRASATDAAGIGEELLATLGDAPEDDIAIVVVRVPTDHDGIGGGSTAPHQRRWQLPGEPGSIGRARHLTVRAAAAWNLHCGPVAELVVSELVANAVLHGWGRVDLRLADVEGGLRIEVEDSNPAGPEPSPARDDGEGGHGLHVVQRLADWGWTATRSGKVVWAFVPGGTAMPVAEAD